MTFDSVTFQPSPSEIGLYQYESRAELRPQKTKQNAISTKEADYDSYPSIQSPVQQGESRVNSSSTGAVLSQHSLDNLSVLTAHIDAANQFMDTGKYEAAYAELKAATERFMDYREKINKSFDNSIAFLTTIGCRATPPHPVALPLIKLRRKLTA